MDSIQILEKLIVEFYDPRISSQRRKEIDNTLQIYEWTPVPWKECLQYVERNENTLVSLFCLKMMESLISKHWSKLPVEEKTMLHSSLSERLVRCETSIPISIKKNLMKLLVKIARNEWSTVGIGFINDIINTIHSDDIQMALLGLNFLLIASEELIEPREIMCSAKKLDIRLQFESNIPQIFCHLHGTFLKYKDTAIGEQMDEILLQVYSQLFSWVPLSDVYTIELLSPIYDCTMHPNYKIRMLAMGSLNEILYKNCVPLKNIPIITSICLKFSEILLKVCECDAIAADEEYLSKILEAVSLIFSTHWHRIECNMELADTILFVSSFYKLSFHTINRQSYRMCLEIWCNFLEYLTMRDVVHKQQYENLLTTLLEEVIRKLYRELFIHENAEEEMTEEMDTFFNQHMNVIDLIAELIPHVAFTLIVDLWNRAKFIYIQSLVGEKLIEAREMDEKEILDAFYAFRVTTQILTSLHSKSPDELKTTIITDLVDVLVFGAGKCTKSYGSRLYQYFIKVHCTLLKATPTWIGNDKSESGVIVTNIFALMLPFITNSANTSIPEEVQVAIAEFISSLTMYVTQTNLIQPLIIDPTFKHLPLVARKHLQCAVCYWVCVCKSESYDERLRFLRSLFEIVAPDKIKDLGHLFAILQNCKVTKLDGKELLFQALEPWVKYVTHQYPINLEKQPELCNTSLTFLLEVVRVFQINLKSDFIDEMLFTFDSCFTNLKMNIPCVQGLEKILMIFSLLMEHPGHTLEKHIPMILRTAQNIFLYVRAKDSHASSSEDGVDVEFYKLLCCILINKWPYFNSRSQNETELNQTCQEVDAILSRILESFGEQDINVFRNNLHCIEEMNNKWNFYDKEIFRSKHLSPMLNTLLTTLIEGKHKLLSDDILSAVFHMAKVNFEIFYNKYVPLLLANISGLTEHQIHTLQYDLRPQTDLPSFVQVLSQLINDVRSYQIENTC